VKVQDVVVEIVDASGARIAASEIGFGMSYVCGQQIDPLPASPTAADYGSIFETISLANPAVQDLIPSNLRAPEYTITETFTFINWNEYVVEDCEILINGVEVAP